MTEKEQIRRAIALNLWWAMTHRTMENYHRQAKWYEEAVYDRARYKDHVLLARRLGQQLRSM